DALQPFEHVLPREVVVRPVVERDDDVGEAELRVREHAHGVGQSAEADLDGDRDLLFDFLRRVAREQRDHRDLNVAHVRECLDRQRTERREACGDEQRQQEQDVERLVQRKGDDAANHWLASASSWRSSSTPSVTTRSPAARPRTTRRRSAPLGVVSMGRRVNSPAPTSTYTKLSPPSTKAALAGTVSAGADSGRCRSTDANIPGLRRSPAFATRKRTLAVRVCGSTTEAIRDTWATKRSDG